MHPYACAWRTGQSRHAAFPPHPVSQASPRQHDSKGSGRLPFRDNTCNLVLSTSHEHHCSTSNAKLSSTIMSSFHMNIFRILGDLSHTASKCILIWAIHSNRSAEGVSLLTQLLYILVFLTRYLDLFWVAPWFSWWNFVLKIFYVTSSAYIVFLMMRVFARTREKEYGWKLAIWCLAGSTVAAVPVCLLFEGWRKTSIMEVSRAQPERA